MWPDGSSLIPHPRTYQVQGRPHWRGTITIKADFGGLIWNTAAEEILSSAGPLQGCHANEAKLVTFGLVLKSWKSYAMQEIRCRSIPFL